MRPQHETLEEEPMDLLIALLQSLVVLLLASGVYVALVVRKGHAPDDAKPEVTRHRPTIVT